MMDDIYYGNLLGLLKTGKWSLSLSEASALILIAQETERRLKPPAVNMVDEPIKRDKKIKG